MVWGGQGKPKKNPGEPHKGGGVGLWSFFLSKKNRFFHLKLFFFKVGAPSGVFGKTKLNSKTDFNKGKKKIKKKRTIAFFPPPSHILGPPPFFVAPLFGKRNLYKRGAFGALVKKLNFTGPLN